MSSIYIRPVKCYDFPEDFCPVFSSSFNNVPVTILICFMFLQSSNYYLILYVGLPVWFWPVSQECESIVTLILPFCSNTMPGAGILPDMQCALSEHLLVGGEWIFIQTLSPAQHFQPERGQQSQMKGCKIQPSQPKSHCPSTSRSQMANSVP